MNYPGVTGFLAAESDVSLDIVLNSIPDNVSARPLHYQDPLIVIVVDPVSIRKHTTQAIWILLNFQDLVVVEVEKLV